MVYRELPCSETPSNTDWGYGLGILVFGVLRFGQHLDGFDGRFLHYAYQPNIESEQKK
jgi:hypothetical protein